MNVRTLQIALALAAAVSAELWYTFVDFHLYFPVMPHDVARVVSLFPPNDLALYRAYVPEAYAMPDQPMVKVDFVEVTPTWHEAFVSLRVKYKGELGWYGVTWPIDATLPYALGYWVGYPKFMAGAMTWRRTDGGYVGSVEDHGETYVALEFTDADATESPLEPALLDDTAAYFNLMPPLHGPQVNRLANHMLVQNAVRHRAGRVRITVNAREKWAKLVTNGTERVEPGYLVSREGRAFGFLIAHKVN